MTRRSWTGLLLAIGVATLASCAVRDVTAAGTATQPTQAGSTRPRAELRIWREFVSLLKSGQFTKDRIRPLPEMVGLADTLMGFLEKMRTQAHWAEWDRDPEIEKNGAVINFILPLTFGQEPPTSYCFMFVREGETWYFHHLEAIFIRLDKTPQPPTSTFPDTTEAQKAWDREEDYWSTLVRWRGSLVKEKGKGFFLDLIKDGNGYFVWAKTRVPFVPPHRAFILFLCWEQAHLRGLNAGRTGVTLEKLTDDEAVVRLSPTFFMLYEAAAHLKPQISLADYTEIFETIWQDRARAAGWALKIEYTNTKGYTECVFRFHRNPVVDAT